MSKVFARNGRMIRMAAFSALVAAGLCALSAWAIDDAEWQTLSKGQVVVKQNMSTKGEIPSVEAKILVPKPLGKVWSVVSDPVKLMEEEAKVKRVQVLSRTGNRQQVAFSVMMTRLLPTFDYVLQQDLLPPHQLRFKRISGSFREIQGSWRLLPADNGTKTILTYTLKLDPGPLIPKGLLLNAVKADLPVMMQNAKQAIVKGG